MSVAIQAAQRAVEMRRRVVDLGRQNAQAMVEVGRRLQTVVAHEGWQEYVSHLEVIIEQKTKARDQIAKDTLEGDALGEELEKLKISALRLGSEIAGLKVAVDLIPELLKRAAKAAESLGPDR